MRDKTRSPVLEAFAVLQGKHMMWVEAADARRDVEGTQEAVATFG